jgi:hypothetical protein
MPATVSKSVVPSKRHYIGLLRRLRLARLPRSRQRTPDRIRSCSDHCAIARASRSRFNGSVSFPALAVNLSICSRALVMRSATYAASSRLERGRAPALLSACSLRLRLASALRCAISRAFAEVKRKRCEFSAMTIPHLCLPNSQERFYMERSPEISPNRCQE